jgi:hypothetical protein
VLATPDPACENDRGLDTMARAIPGVHVWLSVAATILTAAIIVYARLSALRLRRLHAASDPRVLTTDEMGRLGQWGRRDVAAFIATMAVLVGYSVLAGFVAPGAMVVGYAVVIGLAIASLAHHFAACCPSCRRRIGLQSGLGLPLYCEICGAAFRPEAPSMRALRLQANTRYVSATRLLGLPLLAMATGPDPASGQVRGVAKGWIALGDVAIGVLAVGGVACGVVAVGGLGVGLVSIAGLALGACALGGLAVGGVSFGAVAVGVLAGGGVAIGYTAVGGLAIGVLPHGGRVVPL